MRTLSLSILAAGIFVLAGCGSSTAPTVASIFSDSIVTADISATSGDAMAAAYSDMVASETGAGLSAPVPANLSSSVDDNFSYSRTRTCFDANGVVVNCTSTSSVRKVVTHVTADGSRADTNTTTGGKTTAWNGASHRVADDTVTRNFNTADPPVEVSRTHSGGGVAHDTTSFSGDSVARRHIETAHDRFNGVTWNLPRSTNPFPISGSIVRVDSIHATFTKGTASESRDVVRTVEVDFPADAQGNVTITITGKTCTLNLVTHKVVNCH